LFFFASTRLRSFAAFRLRRSGSGSGSGSGLGRGQAWPGSTSGKTGLVRVPQVPGLFSYKAAIVAKLEKKRSPGGLKIFIYKNRHGHVPFCYFLPLLQFCISCIFPHIKKKKHPQKGYYPDMANSAPAFFY
jgi:hypothetical protein